MSKSVHHWYRKTGNKTEDCFNIEISETLSTKEEEILQTVLAEGFKKDEIKKETTLDKTNIVEIGPRLNFATAFSTNAVAILNAIGLNKITRIELSKRYVLDTETNVQDWMEETRDKMTQMQYEKPLKSFDIDIQAKEVFEVDLLGGGKKELEKMNTELGLGMDDWDINFYFKLFTRDIKRNPTNVECFQLGQANSEHSRHWFFKGKLIIDGENIKENLFDIVSEPHKQNKENSVIAFSDNSSAIKGKNVRVLVSKKPGRISSLVKKNILLDSTLTAETHNFPSGVAPLPGAETGAGGRIRDNQSTGRGAHVVAGTTGYCVGNLQIPDYALGWESEYFEYPDTLASPLKILIDASNGASDYGNKFGEPMIQGFARSFGLKLPRGRREWLKPIMFTAGVGHIDHEHTKKGKPKKGMVIIQIGGPMYRIGVGGGAASSMMQGENKAELDFNAVQRGDAEMEQKMNRVVRACIEMGEKNPIISIHDQGAGGPCNVLTEIVEPVGGRVEIRNINIGDSTLSVLEIWSAEAQERNALLINQERVEEFKNICEREHSMYEILGEVTDTGRIVLHDEKDDSEPVNLELEKILGKMPQKQFVDDTRDEQLQPLQLPKDITVETALPNVLKLLSVASKRFLVNKVDRSVTGLIAQQQCCGPLQLPLSDFAITARSLEKKTGGTVISIGEQPIKTLVSPRAGARMSVAEALTNMMFAKISKLENIKCSGNWMWAAKLPGEASNMYKAAVAMSDTMLELGIALDGGKDSLSMVTKVGDELVKSPGELTISAYADMENVENTVTPDIKTAGESSLWFIDIAGGATRMGGSALAQTHSQVGNDTPDLEDVSVLKDVFNAVQKMVDEKVITAGHDRSDGGLITTVLEMAFAGDCGLTLETEGVENIPYWFNEELGVVVEVPKEKEVVFLDIVDEYMLASLVNKLGTTTKKKHITILNNDKEVLNKDMLKLRALWEETGYELNALQRNKDISDQEKENTYNPNIPQYKSKQSGLQVKEINSLFAKIEKDEDGEVPLGLKALRSVKDAFETKHKIAVIREEGSNGDREMAAAFLEAGFDVWDVNMDDLEKEKVSLKDFRGIAFVGGFSYADTLGSAKGWASKIKFNKKLSEEFNEFYNRVDTFSLGVCNGCQLMGLLGWVPKKGVSDKEQPHFIENKSGKFESRWVSVKIEKSPSIMFEGMEDSVLGVWVAHGEGQLDINNKVLENVKNNNLAPLVYVDDKNTPTEKYPFNPNGSVDGVASLCSEDGRHLAMMPHPERAYLKWQWPYMSEENNKEWSESPWLQMFKNAKIWCDKN